MSFGVFAESQWSALVLPTLKLSTRHGCELLGERWRALDLEIGTLAVRESVYEGRLEGGRFRLDRTR